MPVEQVKPSPKYDNITLQDFGRRPTTINDIKGLLTLIDMTPGNVLEIGAWFGKTTYELATRFPLKSIHTVDFLEITLEYDCAMTTRASKKDLCKYAKHLPNVIFHYVKSDQFDYDGEGITMVFIDGDHGYQGVKADTEKALQNLPRGGIICWHDSFQRRFGVPAYLEAEIDPKFRRYAFPSSQITFIKI